MEVAPFIFDIVHLKQVLKKQAGKWNVVNASFHFLHDTTALRDDLLSRTGCSLFPLYFCATQRIEDSDAAKRLISIWQNIVWLCAFMRKWQSKQPSWKSFLKVQKAVNDKLIVAKLQFFSFIGDHLTVPNWCSTDSRFVRWFKKTYMSKSKSHQEK